MSEASKLWIAAHPEKMREYGRAWDRKNRVRKTENSRRWYKKNKHKVKAQRATPEARAKQAACNRRYYATKNGFVECVNYPPPPIDSRCDLCSTPSKLILDHDHRTGKFRGYLCLNCNLGLGKLGDNLESLKRAVAYLKKKHAGG